MNNMQITTIVVDDAKLWDGAKVKSVKTGKIGTIKVLPKDKTIFQCVQEGIFDPNKHFSFEFFMNNKSRFKLLK